MTRKLEEAIEVEVWDDSVILAKQGKKIPIHLVWRKNMNKIEIKGKIGGGKRIICDFSKYPVKFTQTSIKLISPI